MSMGTRRTGERDPFFAWLVSSTVSGMGFYAFLDAGPVATLLA
ncbi:MAG: hypothetical protein ABIY38_04005 [Rhodococcus sp. (in: high G+C Gram-positive bacteria)]